MKERNIVYSTDPNWGKKEVIKKHQSSNKDQTKQTAYIERDRKKRAGKVVTVVSNLQGNLKELQKELQKLCGSGGTVKNGNVEIQGDHRDKIAEYLQKKGIKTKFIGG
jgi:translation initiation factor 1